MDSNIELAQQLLDSENKFSVSFDLAWQWIGYSRKDSAKKSFLNSGFIQGEDLRIAVEPTTTGISGGDVNESIFSTIECFKMWGMMAKTSQGRQIRSYFLECEQVAKQAITQQFISTVAEPLVIMPTE